MRGFWNERDFMAKLFLTLHHLIFSFDLKLHIKFWERISEPVYMAHVLFPLKRFIEPVDISK